MYNPYPYYYDEPSGLDSSFWGPILIILILVFLAFHHLLLHFIGGWDKKVQYKIFKLVVIFSPIWFFVLLFFLIAGMFSIASAEANLFTWIFTVVILYIFFELYYTIAAFPAATAYNIINVLNDVFLIRAKSCVLTFWSLLDTLKRRRLLVLLFLIALLAAVVLLNGFLFSEVVIHFSDISTYNYVFFLALLTVSTGALIIYLFLEIFNHGKVHIPRIKHRKSVNLQRAIGILSVTTGIPAPDFQILAYDNPTIFSTFPNFGKPTIYITAPLLNVANDNELEALVGHEFANIFSGRILYFKQIHNILIVLRTLAFFLFFLFLLLIDPLLLIPWLALLGYASINVIEPVTADKFSFELLLKLSNPPLLFVNFLSYFVYYAIARNEEFYTDMKTIEFTRYPAGIYSILQKLKAYTGARKRLPKRFSYLYFTAEETTFDEIPMPQPLIEEREAAIERLGMSRGASKHLGTKEEMRCPNCKGSMEVVMLRGSYGNFLRAYYCRRCDSFWIDGWNLWCISTSPFIKASYFEEIRDEIKISKDLICPRCGVNLLLLKERRLPADIKIWYCPICNGNWLSKNDVLKYAAYKRKFIKNKK